jgi:hypothetical protein
MPTGQRTGDTSFLEAALIGFQQMKRNVEEKIADIQRQLGSGDGMPTTAPSQIGRRTCEPGGTQEDGGRAEEEVGRGQSAI